MTTVQPLTENRVPLPEPTILSRTPPKARTRLSPDLLLTESYSDFSVDRVSPGVARIILRPNTRITDDDCIRTGAELLALTGGKPGAVLLQVSGVGSVSRTAISLYCEAAAVTAFAILGSTPVDRVIAHTLLRLAPPKCPTEYFTDEEEALIWLRTTP
ncbi:hypothetical protein QFZ23_002097 [Arthrobacter globiformis]|uniref:DUF7793 family protein n=1 Tax=Arthrobacter globiformis TaxID=1665 RepID=UPI0027874DAB|nr:hypothetical protein [Arthrobacter globiformis]MDQ1058196.1 hypothetical protein [Arthrobacter globiformis]